VKPRFEILEHPADIGFRVRGGTLVELFENAAAAMLSIADLHPARTRKGMRCKSKAPVSLCKTREAHPWCAAHTHARRARQRGETVPREPVVVAGQVDVLPLQR
jgi:hypothetical protein